MVKRIKLSQNTIESVLKDVEAQGCKDITGMISEAPIFVLIPMDDNQIVVGVDGRREEVGFKDKPLLPQSLISAAIFVGEGSRSTFLTIDGVPINVG